MSKITDEQTKLTATWFDGVRRDGDGRGCPRRRRFVGKKLEERSR